MIPVSACVISYNEEDRIESCLRSLDFCAEIVVLDSLSTDRTCEIARSRGARVLTQEFLGHQRQKQKVVDLAEHDWVLCLDCDETVSDDLRREIEQQLDTEPEGVVGFRMPRRNFYLGKTMRHGFFWPDRKLRLFDRRKARWGGVDPHDRVEPTSPGDIVDLIAPIIHDSYRSFSEHRETVSRFARMAARAMAETGSRAGLLSPWTHGSLALLKSLILKLGVLDGWRGVLAAWMSAKYDYLKYRELRGMTRGS